MMNGPRAESQEPTQQLYYLILINAFQSLQAANLNCVHIFDIKMNRLLII